MALSRRALLLGAAGVVGALATGCGNKSETAPRPAPSPTPTPTPTPTPEPPPPSWPLTGLPLEDPGAVQHAAVAAKVPDNQFEHPQLGLNDADIVFVELDGYQDSYGENGTRLVPVFHSTLPEAVGPIRSLRPVDVPLIAPITGVIANTGGAGWVVDYAEQEKDRIDVGQTYMETRGTGAYSIDGSRVYTHNGQKYYDRAVQAHPAVLSQANTTFAAGPPTPYLPFAVAKDQKPSTDTGQAATRVEIPWKSGDRLTVSYDWDAQQGKYLRNTGWGEHTLADGTRVVTDTILIIQAEVTWEKLIEGSGGAEPIHHIIDASGPFHCASGGKVVTGTWAKKGPEAPFTFMVADGNPLLIAPGRTWIELPSPEATIAVK